MTAGPAYVPNCHGGVSGSLGSGGRSLLNGLRMRSPNPAALRRSQGLKLDSRRKFRSAKAKSERLADAEEERSKLFSGPAVHLEWHSGEAER